MKFRSGILYKKIFNDDGTVKANVPMFLKTLARLVMTEEGKSVETKLKELDEKKTYRIFDTREDYFSELYEGGKPNDDGTNFNPNSGLKDMLVIILNDKE